MIIDVLARLLFTVLEPLVSVLPTTDWTKDDLPDGVIVLGHQLGYFDAYVPIIGPMKIVLAYLGAFLVFFALRVGIWLWGLLPGKAS